jgi:hypothetical protein
MAMKSQKVGEIRDWRAFLSSFGCNGQFLMEAWSYLAAVCRLRWSFCVFMTVIIQ